MAVYRYHKNFFADIIMATSEYDVQFLNNIPGNIEYSLFIALTIPKS